MKLSAICIGQPHSVNGLNYKTGIDKHPVAGPVMLDRQGLVGDAILNRKHHGGPDQALYLEGSLTLAWWETELSRALSPGAFGENLVIEGLDNRDLAIGDRLTIGETLIEITAARIPCATFCAHMQDPTFAKRYTKAARPGAYARVISGTLLEAGASVRLQAYTGDRLMVASLIGRSLKTLDDSEKARFLALPIAERMRAQIMKQR
ncbi:MOSC domain-containing protein [Allorhizobium sp. BGMRC 0089]|uniref:MOSC domain-containing protein n=1 Tax=Allorhizobium sonneratiae TaxID=2934936 RepID=UPI0020336C62|nr:MOSC domain-containing protein [Allorhizobium sonneratiae]MCM2291738.1 MOSC domain-containing protein [Allorhizobium sonneratiae]